MFVIWCYNYNRLYKEAGSELTKARLIAVELPLRNVDDCPEEYLEMKIIDTFEVFNHFMCLKT